MVSAYLARSLACWEFSWCQLESIAAHTAPKQGERQSALTLNTPQSWNAFQLAVIFTHSGAMDLNMLKHIDHDVMRGVSFTAAWQRVATFLRSQHNEAEVQYLSLNALVRQGGFQTTLDRGVPSGPVLQSPPFANLRKLYLSSSQWCSTLWLKFVEARVLFAQRITSAVLGRFLSGDHTFRLAKFVRAATGEQTHLAVFSLKNEHGEVLGYWATHITSLLEIKAALLLVAERYRAIGVLVSECVFCTSCRALLQSTPRR